MGYGVKALRKIQLGRESTAGTIVAATVIWRGEGTIEDARIVEFPVEDIGLVPATTRSYQPAMGAKLSLASTPATFEQLNHVFEMGIKTVTAASDGAGSDKIYTYPMPTTSAMFLTPTANNIPVKSYTIQGGDNEEAEVMEFCHVTDFELSFKAGEPVKVSANILGRQVALQAFTGSLAQTTAETILSSKGKVYVDLIGGTVGTTQITNEILSGSIKVNTGIKAIQTSEGNLYFSFIKGVRPEIVTTLQFEHSTFGKAEKVYWRAGTPRLLQIKFEGSSVTTPGTTYSKKTLIFNTAGVWEKFSPLGDTDGDDVITGTFRSGYDSTAAQFASFIHVNELASVP